MDVLVKWSVTLFTAQPRLIASYSVLTRCLLSFQLEVEEEKEEEVKKEKKEKKEKSKSWGRRSTRAKKSISYRYEVCTKLRIIRKVLCVVGLYCFSMVAVKSLNNYDILFAGLMNLMRLLRRQLKKTSERLMVEVARHYGIWQPSPRIMTFIQ